MSCLIGQCPISANLARQFLRTQASTRLACDFFHVAREINTVVRGWMQYYGGLLPLRAAAPPAPIWQLGRQVQQLPPPCRPHHRERPHPAVASETSAAARNPKPAVWARATR